MPGFVPFHGSGWPPAAGVRQKDDACHHNSRALSPLRKGVRLLEGRFPSSASSTPFTPSVLLALPGMRPSGEWAPSGIGRQGRLSGSTKRAAVCGEAVQGFCSVGDRCLHRFPGVPSDSIAIGFFSRGPAGRGPRVAGRGPQAALRVIVVVQ